MFTAIIVGFYVAGKSYLKLGRSSPGEIIAVTVVAKIVASSLLYLVLKNPLKRLKEKLTQLTQKSL